ncbi:hypothetical protein [Rhizobium laguerreae]|uniref:hypothetical protein n=1 Tax=Rhizobium laguerreae TaxID=1076926 RepID=UPI001C91A92B|nr:hypothetical protein [Rhizobium laguerreae]MBY3314705.1 hypothetical protein [Rhizobium laguerreae]
MTTIYITRNSQILTSVTYEEGEFRDNYAHGVITSHPFFAEKKLDQWQDDATDAFGKFVTETGLEGHWEYSGHGFPGH